MTLTIYLSGGTHSNWRDIVMDQLQSSSFEFIDPKQNGQPLPERYAPWDLFGVERSDIVLCYVEHDNPSGVGTCFEAAYGLGLGKHVVTVIEPQDRKYWDIVQVAASVNFGTLQAAVDYIQSLAGPIFGYVRRRPKKKGR